MTTTTRRPPTTFSPLGVSGAIFKWRSLKTRVTVFTLTFFLIGIWSLALYSSYTLHRDMEQTLGEQQFSTVSIMAADINAELGDRLRSLEKIAARITPAMLGNAATMQSFLEERVILQSLFNGGTVYRLDGTAIAEVPFSAGRVGINYADRDYIVGTLREGKATIGKPYLSMSKKFPEFVMAVPIRDTQGKAIGALAVVIDLGKPNFLDKVTKYRYGKSGGYFLVAPQYRLIVTASDKSRIMQQFPAPGVNPALDRFIQGYEGFDVYVNPLGLEVLASGKSIPVAGWVMGAVLPTAEAFAPVHAMQQRILIATIFLTLLVGGLTWWMLKRQLAPIFTTIKTLATLSDIDQHPQPLPIIRQDEIGKLIGSFNRMLETLGQREEALRESETSSRTLIENSFDVIFTLNSEGTFLLVSTAWERHFGYPVSEVIGKNFALFVHPDDVGPCAEYLKAVLGTGQSGVSPEYRVKHANGSWRWFITNGSPYVDPKGNPQFMGTGRDITDRKRAAEALRETNAYLENLINYANAPIIVWDPQFRITRFNHAFEFLTGRNEAEVLGKSLELLFPSALVEDSMALIRKTMTGKRWETVEIKILHCDESVHTLLWNSATLFAPDGQTPIATIAQGHDITKRKLAEEALEEERRQLQQALDEVRTLRGIVPICSYCKKIRDDEGYWNQVEQYVSKHTEAQFSHGICPACLEREMKTIKGET